MDELQELRSRLARLEAAEAVRNHYARYTRAVDSADEKSLAPLFADDVVVRNPREWHGRDTALSHYRAFFDSGAERTRHYATNMEIEVEDETHASVHAYFFVTAVLSGESVMGWGWYDDRLECRDGTWVFVVKQNVPGTYWSLPGGFAEGSEARPWARRES